MSADDVLNELDAAIAHAKDHPLHETTQKEAMDALGDKVDNAKHDVVHEIKALAQYTLDIEAAMHDIDDIFQKVTSGNASSQLKGEIESLRKTWSGHIETYVQLLWQSRSVAGDAEGAAMDFAGDFISFLDDESTPFSQKQAEIANYLAKLAEDEKRSREMSQGFSNLQQEIANFQKDWKTIIDKHNLDAMHKEVAELQKEIDKATKALATLREKIQLLSVALGIFTVAAGITGILGFICPLFWFDTVISIVGIGITASLLHKTQDTYNHTRADLQRNQAKLATLMADIEAVKQLKAGLKKSEGDFNTILTRIGAFAQVWATIHADVQAIEEKLEYAHRSGSWKLMHSRLKTAAKLYTTLGHALHQYQVSVNPDLEVFKGRNLA
ncbi:hypothetical protein K474DRAFT_1700031 [Panus rudis PR-1116 ss-1]|nr:hypothetical protein K474DRAFT_1700031 [Panus rudis PR-1116 ss-1]